MKTKSLYHYKESGLDNVWLRNGFTVRKTSYGEAVSIDDIDGLHDSIARDLVEKPAPLAAKEIRFLRKHLGRSQRELADLLGADEQTVSRWERGTTKMPPSADRLLRGLYRESADGNARLKDLLENVVVRYDKSARRVELQRARSRTADGNRHWKVAA